MSRALNPSLLTVYERKALHLCLKAQSCTFIARKTRIHATGVRNTTYNKLIQLQFIGSFMYALISIYLSEFFIATPSGKQYLSSYQQWFESLSLTEAEQIQ